jgi:hypothetical protein
MFGVAKGKSRRNIHTLQHSDAGEVVAPWIRFYFPFFYVNRTTESAFCLLSPYMLCGILLEIK